MQKGTHQKSTAEAEQKAAGGQLKFSFSNLLLHVMQDKILNILKTNCRWERLVLLVLTNPNILATKSQFYLILIHIDTDQKYRQNIRITAKETKTPFRKQ